MKLPIISLCMAALSPGWRWRTSRKQTCCGSEVNLSPPKRILDGGLFLDTHPFKQPLLMPNKIGIDTGAVYGNYLTALKLPETEFFFDH